MGYPDFVSDRDGLERWRAHALEGDGHDMANANKNTLYRFVQTVDNLETALAEARRQIAERDEALKEFAGVTVTSIAGEDKIPDSAEGPIVVTMGALRRARALLASPPTGVASSTNGGKA